MDSYSTCRVRRGGTEPELAHLRSLSPDWGCPVTERVSLVHRVLREGVRGSINGLIEGLSTSIYTDTNEFQKKCSRADALVRSLDHEKETRPGEKRQTRLERKEITWPNVAGARGSFYENEGEHRGGERT